MTDPARPAAPAAARDRGAPRPGDALGAPTAHPPRRARLAAAGRDALRLALVAGAAALLAAGWLLARTALGAYDVGAGDAAFAWAGATAALPAGLGWLAAACCLPGGDLGATPGQARSGLALLGSAPRRLAWLLAHPLSLPAWTWLAAVGWLWGDAATGTGAGALLPALAGTAVAGGGIASAVLLAARPGARPFHERVSGARLRRIAPPAPAERRP